MPKKYMKGQVRKGKAFFWKGPAQKAYFSLEGVGLDGFSDGWSWKATFVWRVKRVNQFLNVSGVVMLHPSRYPRSQPKRGVQDLGHPLSHTLQIT